MPWEIINLWYHVSYHIYDIRWSDEVRHARGNPWNLKGICEQERNNNNRKYLLNVPSVDSDRLGLLLQAMYQINIRTVPGNLGYFCYQSSAQVFVEQFFPPVSSQGSHPADRDTSCTVCLSLAPPQDAVAVSSFLMFTIILNGVLTKSVTKIQHHRPQCRVGEV